MVLQWPSVTPHLDISLYDEASPAICQVVYVFRCIGSADSILIRRCWESGEELAIDPECSHEIVRQTGGRPSGRAWAIAMVLTAAGSRRLHTYACMLENFYEHAAINFWKSKHWL